MEVSRVGAPHARQIRFPTPRLARAQERNVSPSGIDADSGTPTTGNECYGLPNGTLNNDDFFYYLIEFIAGNVAVADLTTTAVPGSAGYGVPN